MDFYPDGLGALQILQLQVPNNLQHRRHSAFAAP